MAWYLLAWQRATDFSGRSRRMEYWYFQLFNLLVVIFVFGLALLAGGDAAIKVGADCCFAYCLVAFCAHSRGHCTSTPRHRKKRILVFHLLHSPHRGNHSSRAYVLDSDPDRNEYGPNPKVPEDIKVVI